jgi:hypothetical protein
MQALGDFDEAFSRRLGAELDAIDVWTPARGWPRRRRTFGALRIARPVAVALVAALAPVSIATAVTGSPDPARWVQPAVWARALGVAKPSPQPSSGSDSSPAARPSESPEPHETSNPTGPEPEPSERPGTTSPEPGEPNDPGERQGPDG